MTETAKEPWTIQRLLNWTSEFFTQRGLDAPRLAAEVLLAEALECPRIQLYARFNEIPVEPQLGKFRDWLKRHATGEPVAYLVGHREFYSLRFEVNEHVLIPRPETENLVMLAVDHLKALPEQEQRFIDIGTGSGCIAVTLLKQCSNATGIAVDVSKDAIEVATRNAKFHNVSDRLETIESNLFEQLPADLKVPVIVSNPPYIGTSEDGTVEESVRKHEPNIALFGGEVGDELTRQLIASAINHLLPDGRLLIETSPLVAQRLQEFANSLPQIKSCETRKDLSKLDRILDIRTQ
ncbi:MAG: peptide chain release factor N(5)-glutamine methyltransferase [Pirellulaceae bacterium]